MGGRVGRGGQEGHTSLGAFFVPHFDFDFACTGWQGGEMDAEDGSWESDEFVRGCGCVCRCVCVSCEFIWVANSSLLLDQGVHLS